MDNAPQYLAELMCKRLAQKNKQTLPSKFWNLPEWRMIYKNQLIAAHALIKVYDPRAIIAAVERKTFSWVYSLRYPGLRQAILEEEAKLKIADKKIEKAVAPQIENPTLEPQKPFSNKQSRTSKLDD